MLRLSVIVPVYNVEKYLERCVSSLLQQEVQGMEIILVDDKSPDSSPILCDKYAKIDSRIKVIHKKENQGLGFARNTGLEVAKGEYVTFVDSDDYVEKDTYNKVLAECSLHNLDICYFRHRRVDEYGNYYQVSDDLKTYDFYSKNDYLIILSAMMGGDVSRPKLFQMEPTVWGGVYRRDLLIKENIYFKSEREVVSEDLVFHIDLLPHTNRIKVLPNVYYNYFVNTKSLSTSYSDEKLLKILNLLKYLGERLPLIYNNDNYKGSFISYILIMFKSIIRFETWGKKSIISKCKSINKICNLEILKILYDFPIKKYYAMKDRVFVFCMKHHISIFFVFLYKLAYHKYGLNK
ncbi:MAG: glycosyltransferase [Bacteroidales bacterium]|nr:glycosyltransferase [Bacteroidales bacterium]